MRARQVDAWVRHQHLGDGDRLHFSLAFYQAMADAVNLAGIHQAKCTR